MFDTKELELLGGTLDKLAEGFSDLPDFDQSIDSKALSGVLEDVARRMQDNYPYPHPLYAGQMLKPPHPVARLAYALSLWINPNNHALDGGRASSAMEKACIRDLGSMFGWDEPLGHLTGGGTMANLEALWVADSLKPGKRVLASDQAHYTHGRISGVLKIPFGTVASDANARMDIEALEQELLKNDVGTVVVTLGTTGTGAVDPLADVLALRERFDFRVHVDAAYGGYLVLSENLDPETARHYSRIGEADSIVIDPHKHGLQPYGCGCVLFRDPSVVRFYKHDSAYTYYSSDDLHLGEISLECSRAGSSAVALWATHRLLPPVPGGEFATALDRSVAAARKLHRGLAAGGNYVAINEPQLDICVFSRNVDSKERSRENRRIFADAAARNLHLALIELPPHLNRSSGDDSVSCLRSVLMKPEHEDWIDTILSILDDVA